MPKPNEPVTAGGRITAKRGVYLRVLDDSLKADAVGDRDRFRIVVDDSCNHLTDPDPTHARQLLPPGGSPAILVHGRAPMHAAVTEIAKAWNWAAKTLAAKSMHDTAHRFTYHLVHQPHNSELSIRIGSTQLTDTVVIGNATDRDAFTRAAWRCAIQLMERQCEREGIEWRAGQEIYSKAFARSVPTR